MTKKQEMWHVDSYLVAIITFCICAVIGDDTHIRYMEAREGSNLSVVCNISDGSNATVYWTKNDTRYTFKPGKYLKLDHIKQNNTGYYTCHSLDTSLPAYNGTAADTIVDVIHIVVLDAKQVDNRNQRPNGQVKQAKSASDNSSHDGDDDNKDDDDNTKTQTIVVLTLSAVGTVAVVIFLVYLMKYRQPRRKIYSVMLF
ncbi:uncharacterized protein LOC132753615 [Ruditapes philippinarum]|uniref:uncharacterized protein LOC132753615 n=1 Tax=Ruditapes philippinarum TaxID=129788 RepID=UPI00295BBCAC|nr:uncharacterized protein LOC132753615 [Ruditapes philippinarum]